MTSKNSLLDFGERASR